MVRTQNQCPLFTLLPKEIREIVFEFALTDDKGQSLESLIKRNVSRLRIQIQQQKPSNDIAVNLLRTCRAIYMETWTLPLSLNPYVVYDLQNPAILGMKLYELLPWQFALIQSLDITLQQTALEGDMLHRYLHRERSWQPKERHKGVYLAPRRYKASRGPRAMTDYLESFNCSLIPSSNADTDSSVTHSSTETPEPRHFLSHLLGQRAKNPAFVPPWHSSMRVMLASPLTRLTLRLQHSDWWSWTDSPTSVDPLHYLALDPSVGDGRIDPLARPTFPRMRALAEARRAGHHPNPDPGPDTFPDAEIRARRGLKRGKGWACTISQLSDLRSLDLVLETFKSKKGQLEEVVEAGKTWVFPLNETKVELAWDGGLGVGSWSLSGLGKENARGAWHSKEQEFEVRNLRYVRRRVKG